MYRVHKVHRSAECALRCIVILINIWQSDAQGAQGAQGAQKCTMLNCVHFDAIIINNGSEVHRVHWVHRVHNVNRFVECALWRIVVAVKFAEYWVHRMHKSALNVKCAF